MAHQRGVKSFTISQANKICTAKCAGVLVFESMVIILIPCSAPYGRPVRSPTIQMSLPGYIHMSLCEFAKACELD